MNAAPVEPHPVYAVVGADRFLRSDALESILTVVAGEADTLGPTRVDGPQAALADVLDEVRTVSLLGDRRVVIVDEADKFITANRAALERYCAAPATSGSLILLCNTLAKNTRLYRIINNAGAVIHCTPPKGQAVIGWIVDRAQANYGKRLGRAAGQMLSVSAARLRPRTSTP